MYSQLAINELYKAFNLLNQHYYEGKLPEVVIIPLTTAKKQAYGWFTPNKVWADREKTIERHEIAMSAEWMHSKSDGTERNYVDVIRTLHHEMIHLHCHINKIKDTTKKGKYHTEKFKEESIKRGFVYTDTEPHPKFGWSFNELTPEAIDIIKGFNLNEEAFKVARAIIAKKKKVRVTYKYMCPECECKVRSKKVLNLHCNDCDTDFVEY